MPAVRVEIVEYLSDRQPGFVAAKLVDAFGVTHTFHDKVPIFTSENLDSATPLPVAGWIHCEILNQINQDGRDLIRIDTEKPFDIESIAGQYHFLVEVGVVDTEL